MNQRVFASDEQSGRENIRDLLRRIIELPETQDGAALSPLFCDGFHHIAEIVLNDTTYEP